MPSGITGHGDRRWAEAWGAALASTTLSSPPTPRPRPAEQPLPRTVGRFLIRGVLGHGGMGEVFLAHDPRLDRDVALKLLPPELADDPQRRERFLVEARAAAALNHPNITTIHEIGKADGRDYLALEYVEGLTIAELLTTRRLLRTEFVNLAAQVAEALEYAHHHAIVHCDIKPANVMVNALGQAKLLDFGLALIGQLRTGEGARAIGISGTPSAMSPEQAAGAPLDVRSDVFSFGSLLYEMAAGTPAFSGATAADTMEAVLHAEPPALESLRPDLPPALIAVLRRAMHKDPDQRPQAMGEVVAELRRFRRQSDARRISGPLGRVVAPRALMALALLLVALALTLAVAAI
jgi:eukaryotic-like serine/threonine-protein kinase